MENSEISWTDHTFNSWWGCEKVSPACDHCYAETWAKRTGFALWGEGSERRTFGDAHWMAPVKWNRNAEKAGVRAKVFCASMADVFEGRDDLRDERARLWELIKSTPWLDWLLLTKRPENIQRMLPDGWRQYPQHNVWLGTTVENQEQADKRIPELLNVSAVVRFLSCEPLLSQVNLGLDVCWSCGSCLLSGNCICDTPTRIHWVIAGGESGPGARPMHPAWARSLRDQCQTAGVAFHFKQHGDLVATSQLPEHLVPEDAKFEDSTILDGTFMRLGKKAAGRLLDGRTWDEFPRVKIEHLEVQA